MSEQDDIPPECIFPTEVLGVMGLVAAIYAWHELMLLGFGSTFLVAVAHHKLDDPPEKVELPGADFAVVVGYLAKSLLTPT